MLNKSNQERYPMTGTTTPIYIPRSSTSKIIRPGESYFRVKIYGAQAAFRGSLWERVQQLIIISQVGLNHPQLGTEPMCTLQRSRKVERERAEQLGLSPNLINLVPATMTHISISIEFVLDKQNRLSTLSGLINEDAFVAAISLAPGMATVARVISGLSQKILNTFLDPEERQAVLQFTGDFDLATGGFQEGYYVILGTRNEHNPLPDPKTKLAIRNGGLLADGKPVTQLSYIIMEVQYLEARTRSLSDGALWDTKLRQAETAAQRIASDPFTDTAMREQSWKECVNLIKEAQLLLIADPNYLHREAMDIIKSTFTHCYKQIFTDLAERLPTKGREAFSIVKPAVQADLSFLDISPDEDLEATLDRYAEQVAEARRLIRKEGIV